MEHWLKITGLLINAISAFAITSLSQYFPPYWLGTLYSAAFGAFAGAWINNRIRTKKVVVAELNAARAVYALCFSITNRVMSLKDEHIRPMRNRYLQLRQEYDEFILCARSYKGPPPLIFEFRADLNTITPIIIPIQALERHVFDKVSAPPRALAALVELIGSFDALDKIIKHRSDLIKEMREDRKAITPERYFGYMAEDGVIDENFKGTVEAIYIQTDNCIFYSKVLADEIQAYHNRKRTASWHYRLGIRKLKAADWSIAERKGLVPLNDGFAEWLRGFQEEPTRWQRTIAYVRRLFLM